MLFCDGAVFSSLLRDVFYLNQNKMAAIKIQKLLLYVKVVGRTPPVESLNRIRSAFDSLTLYKTRTYKKDQRICAHLSGFQRHKINMDRRKEVTRGGETEDSGG